MDAVAIVGPTASGKTDFSVHLAEYLRSEVVSADSMQFYQGMEIGTAVPPLDIRQRIPHHFIAFVPPDYEMNAGLYQQLARKKIFELKSLGKIPVIVGGSGLYISALIDGLFEGPGRSEEIRKQLINEVEKYGDDYLFERLKSIDPVYSARLTSSHDRVRIIRALEIYEMTGIPLSKWHEIHRQSVKPLRVLQLAIEWDRDTLYQRINNRVDEMIQNGWIDEVYELLTRGYEKDILRLKALGYKEIIHYLKGLQNLEKTIENIKFHHRRYAKRQIIWFRSDKRVRWFRVLGKCTLDYDELLKWAIDQIQIFEERNNLESYPCFLFRHNTPP